MKYSINFLIVLAIVFLISVSPVIAQESIPEISGFEEVTELSSIVPPSPPPGPEENLVNVIIELKDIETKETLKNSHVILEITNLES